MIYGSIGFTNIAENTQEVRKQYSLVFFRFVSVVLFGPLNGLFTQKNRTFPSLMSHVDSIRDL